MDSRLIKTGFLSIRTPSHFSIVFFTDLSFPYFPWYEAKLRHILIINVIIKDTVIPCKLFNAFPTK